MMMPSAAVAAGTADEGEVRDHGVGATFWKACLLRIRAHARFDHAVAAVRALNDDGELYGAVETVIGVDAVVVVSRQHEVPGIDGAAEPFDAVVRAVVDLHEVDRGAAAYACERNAVQFLVR